MAQKKTAAKKNAIRDRIFEVATQLFCERGFNGTSVSEIVEAAGVTKPVLYYYFGSKAGLFDALFREHFYVFRTMVQRAVDSKGTTRERFVRLTLDQFQYIRRHAARFEFLVHTIFGPQQGLPKVRFHEVHEINAQLFSRLLAEGIERGELRAEPLEEMGLAYIGMVNMFTIKHLGDRSWPLTKRVAERLVDLFLCGAGTGQGAPR